MYALTVHHDDQSIRACHSTLLPDYKLCDFNLAYTEFAQTQTWLHPNTTRKFRKCSEEERVVSFGDCLCSLDCRYASLLRCGTVNFQL